MKVNKICLSIVALCIGFSLAAQTAEKKDTFQFTVVKENRITPVKNQASSGTCWSFSALGFLESEIIRKGGTEVDLSEMFVVHHSYSDKVDKYVRTEGKINFAAGGSFYDVLYVLKNYGAVPNVEMEGLNYGEPLHRHGELDAVLKAYADAIVSNPNKMLSTAWKKGFDAVLDAYLGETPTEFTVNSKKFTPKSYAESLGLNADDYVSLTSFTHHPFYEKFAIEIPDNWRWAESYNLPLNEFAQVFDYAVNNGYTIAWASDVSEKGFTRNGLAVLPETKLDKMVGSDQARWTGVSQRDMEAQIYKLESPQPEVAVTQELRQTEFDNHKTTDDHGMQIYGIAKDQNATKYYLVKNSWGTDFKYKGIWYASEAFVKMKTINIIVHKDGIPKEIRKKLDIK